MTVEMISRNVVFHFNKKNLEDSTIPMWCVKTQGRTFYVDHVECDIAWSTKETPNNSHTKGSIKVDKVLLTIDDNNCAKMTTPTIKDVVRIKAEKIKDYARIVIHGKKHNVESYMIDNNISYSSIKTVHSTCGEYEYSICDIKKKEDLTLMALALTNQYRVLQPNEIYYKAYENPELLVQLDADFYGDDDEVFDDDHSDE